MKKRLTTYVLTIVLSIIMIGCGGNASNPSEEKSAASITEESTQPESEEGVQEGATKDTNTNDNDSQNVESNDAELIDSEPGQTDNNDVNIQGDFIDCNAEELASRIMEKYSIKVTKYEDGANSLKAYRFYAEESVDVNYGVQENEDGKISFIVISDKSSDNIKAAVSVMICGRIDSYFDNLSKEELAEITENNYFEHDDLVIFGIINKGEKIGYAICSVDYYKNNIAAPTEEDTTSSSEESLTQQYYNLAMSITKDDCIKDSLGIYSYKGFAFTSDDSAWLDNSLNKDGRIEAGAFYRKLAKCLIGFEYGNSWESYAPYILGYTPETKEEFADKVDDLSSFIVESHAADAIIGKLETLSCVDISKDDSEKFTVFISDVTQCADEMGISEEMLGYIMGGLKDCGADIEFDGNTCTFSVKPL